MKLQFSPKVEAAFHSTWITFVSLAGGFLVSAVAGGAKTPADVIAYAKSNWLVWATANLVAPAVRAYRAQGRFEPHSDEEDKAADKK